MNKKNRQKIRILLFCFAIGIISWIVLSDNILTQLVIGPKLPGYASHAPAGQYIDLDWKILQEGRWKYGTKPIVNPQIAELSGKLVHLKGFMLPLHEAGLTSQFFVAGKPRGCYYCNPPGIAEIAQINTENGKKLNPTDWPVSIYGIFKVATGKPDDQMLYTVDNAVLVAER